MEDNAGWKEVASVAMLQAGVWGQKSDKTTMGLKYLTGSTPERCYGRNKLEITLKYYLSSTTVQGLFFFKLIYSTKSMNMSEMS